MNELTDKKGLIRDAIIYFFICGILFIMKYPITMSDFKVYYLTGERFFNGENFYNLDDSLEFKYLPITGIIFSLFKVLGSVEATKVLWYLANCLLIFFVILKSIRLTRGYYDWRLFYLIILIFGFYLGREILLGQINFLMVFLVILSIEFKLKGKEKWAGVLLGLSTWIKPYSLIFLPYFLVKKNYAAFWYSLLIFLIGLSIPFLFYGITGGIELYISCYKLLNTTSDELYRSIDNVSIWSLYSKWLADIQTAKLLSVISIGIIYIAFLYFVVKTDSSDERSLIVDSAILLILIPLFSPQGWFYQLTTGIMGVLLLTGNFKRFSLFSRGVFVISLLAVPISLYDISGKTVSRWLANHSVLTFAFLAIVFLLLLLRIKILQLDGGNSRLERIGGQKVL